MQELIITKMPWLLSIISIYVQWQLGNKAKSAWLLSLGNQALWLVWICVSQQWGVLTPERAAVDHEYPELLQME